MEKLILDLIMGACIGSSITLIIDCIRDIKATKRLSNHAIQQIEELNADWKQRYIKAKEHYHIVESLLKDDNSRLVAENIKLRRELEAQKAFIEVSEIKKAKAEKITYGEF